MLNWLFSRDLDKVLNDTKRIRIDGIRFKIKKINLIDHMTGAAVLKQTFDIYKTGDQKMDEASEKKIRKHYSEVFVAGVVYPSLSFKEEEGKMCVEKLFFDWAIVGQLYNSIMEFTYGKKKMKQHILAAKK